MGARGLVESHFQTVRKHHSPVRDGATYALIEVAGGAHLRAQRVGTCGEGCCDKSAAKDGGEEEFFHGNQVMK